MRCPVTECLCSDIDKALDEVPKTPSNAYVIRKIRPLLPSYASAYTAQVCLSHSHTPPRTRARAHTPTPEHKT